MAEDPENNNGVEGQHFVKRKMLADEPDIPLHGGKDAGNEEEKFDKGENFDKNFLTKRYPSLALPNIKNKEEIDILGDLDFDSAPAKQEDRKLDVGEPKEKHRPKRSRSRS